MTKVNGPAGLGNLDTTSNSHTGGCSWFDYNGDFLPDLLITNGQGKGHYLFRNQGDGTFVDVTSAMPKANLQLEEAGVATADIDNDGDSDVLIAVDAPTASIQGFNSPIGGPNLLYVNQGDGTFVEAAASWGVVDPRGWRNITVNLADIDNDGLIDAYFGCWAPNSGAYNKNNIMYRNVGGSFAVFPSNTAGNGRDTLTALFWDANFDLYPDLFLGNIAPFHAPPAFDCSDYWLHGGPGGQYTDVTALSPGVGDDSCADMGLDVGDIDNDGDWDLYGTDLFTLSGVEDGNYLYLGSPDGTLSDNVAAERGVLCNDSWPCSFDDFDLDGWVDLWVGCARFGCQDFLYMNQGGGYFDQRSPASWVDGTETKGGSVADYDADGDIDVFFWNWLDESELFRNDTLHQGNWIQFKLIGAVSNRDAIGAVIALTSGGRQQLRRVSGGDSAHSQRDLILTFGLGDRTSASIEVRWPSGVVQQLANLGAGAFYAIDESQGILPETLTPRADYDPKSGLLTVAVKSTYGGRTSLEAEGLGYLRYDAADLRFEGTFALAEAVLTPSVRITSQRGAQATAAVQLRQFSR